MSLWLQQQGLESFRSPYEIQSKLKVGQALPICRFPFSLWDSNTEFIRGSTLIKQFPFSLWDSFSFSSGVVFDDLFPFSLWDSQRSYFTQVVEKAFEFPFSLWDSCKAGHNQRRLQRFPFSLWDSVGVQDLRLCSASFRSPYEILHGYLGSEVSRALEFPFSLWDSQ